MALTSRNFVLRVIERLFVSNSLNFTKTFIQFLGFGVRFLIEHLARLCSILSDFNENLYNLMTWHEKK